MVSHWGRHACGEGERTLLRHRREQAAKEPEVRMLEMRVIVRSNGGDMVRVRLGGPILTIDRIVFELWLGTL